MFLTSIMNVSMGLMRTTVKSKENADGNTNKNPALGEIHRRG